MAPSPLFDSATAVDKDAVTIRLLVRVDELCARLATVEDENSVLRARVAELEAKLGLPPKTPDNSSLPPSKGQSRRRPPRRSREAKPHAGAHRPLHPNPTSRREFHAQACRSCGADVSRTAQFACESYDHIEIPPIEPEVTRVTLMGGVCPCCGKRFKAKAPADLAPGSPFGDNLRAFVIYLRSVQGIALARLVILLRDLFGLTISEGALVAILDASRPAFAAQTSLIKARLLSGTALASDETGVRVGKANWWLWVFHHADNALFVVDPLVEGGGGRPSSASGGPTSGSPTALGSQMGWAKRGHQVCLAHLIRDVQYAIDAGDDDIRPQHEGPAQTRLRDRAPARSSFRQHAENLRGRPRTKARYSCSRRRRPRRPDARCNASSRSSASTCSSS